jgi:predicted transcriptional regulator
MAQILKVASSGDTKTRIMYGANLSYRQLKAYMQDLLGSNLMDHIDGERTYRTSAKGREFLESYGRLGTISSELMLSTIRH